MLYTAVDLPSVTSTSLGDIIINAIEYKYVPSAAGTCNILISFDLLSDSYIKNACLNFSLIGETTGIVLEYCIEEINIYGSDGNYISWASWDSDIPMPIDNYTIMCDFTTEGSEDNQADEDSEDERADMVWIPDSLGIKYHSRPDCSGMKNPIQVTKEVVVNWGYSMPCQRCH